MAIHNDPLPYNSHIVGNGEVCPQPSKLETVESCSVPEAKKQIQGPDHSVGVVLSEHDENGEKYPVIFFSWKHGCLAIKQACKLSMCVCSVSLIPFRRTISLCCGLISWKQAIPPGEMQSCLTTLPVLCGIQVRHGKYQCRCRCFVQIAYSLSACSNLMEPRKEGKCEYHPDRQPPV